MIPDSLYLASYKVLKCLSSVNHGRSGGVPASGNKKMKMKIAINGISTKDSRKKIMHPIVTLSIKLLMVKSSYHIVNG